ncbi:MAG: two-component system sensor histidine kinase CreC [Planctomycetes bacterium]|nr:two-component system sensor histidine kinase CreC [Planctomycetota bacterium]
MSLRTRLGLVLLVILGLGFFFSLRSVLYDLRPHYLATMEDVLIDTSEILAAQVAQNIQGDLSVEVVARAMSLVNVRKLDAQVYDKHKIAVDLQVYICNASGRVVYSSQDTPVIGQNYSSWNDVLLCLRGAYGARVSNEVPGDVSTAVLFIAAPIIHEQKIIGCLTVSKPSNSVAIFVDSGRKHIIMVTIISALIIFLLIICVGIWVTRPIHQLEHFVRQTAAGGMPDKLLFTAPELQSVSEAITDMRSALDGKQYIESYVQQLTHEFKSPLSVISGAGELLQEEMSEKQRLRFVHNILSECDRMKELVDRILLLASVENRRMSGAPSDIILSKLFADLLPIMQVLADERGVQIELLPELDAAMSISADYFLLELAVRNIILNAIQFSPRNAVVSISCLQTAHGIDITCEDSGSGIPDYALSRVCERFYSLQHPESGRKSSGLGLSLVYAVMQLHQGTVNISNASSGGAHVILSFPS